MHRKSFLITVVINSFFFTFRDELCRQGDVLNSPALNYNLLHLSAAVEQQKQQKLLKETPSEEENEAKNIEVYDWVFKKIFLRFNICKY